MLLKGSLIFTRSTHELSERPDESQKKIPVTNKQQKEVFREKTMRKQKVQAK